MASSRDIEILAGKLKKLSEMVRPRTDLSKEEIDRIEHEAWVRGETSERVGGPEANVLFLRRDLEALASLVSFVGGLFPGEVSEEFVRNQSESALFELKGKSGKTLWSAAQKRAAELIASIQNMPRQHEVVLPILKLWLPDGPFNIGAVHFYPREEGDIFSQLIAQHELFPMTPEEFRPVKVYACLLVQARDVQQVGFKAISMVETAFNIIRLFRAYENYHWTAVLQVLTGRESSKRVVFHRPAFRGQDQSQRPWLWTVGSPGPAAPFRIDLSFLSWMRQFGLDTIGDLCFSEPLPDDDVHRRIKEAVHWAGQAKVAASREDAFLRQWIALEVLLSPYERAGGRGISDAAAYLLSKPTADARMKMCDYFYDFWKTRSKIVHGGHRVDASDLEDLANRVRLAISMLTRKHEQGITNLPRWFKQHKYSSQGAQTRDA